MDKIEVLENEINDLNDKNNKRYNNLLADIANKSQIINHQSLKTKELEKLNLQLQNDSNSLN